MASKKETTRREMLKRCVATVGVAALTDVGAIWSDGRAFSETVRAKSTAKKSAAKGGTGASVSRKREFPARFELKSMKSRSRATDSYTQGLVFEVDVETGRDILYESGGRYGKSILRKIDLETGKILQEYRFPKQYFAEGIAVVDDRIFALTWRERACFVFDKKTFKKIDEFRYSGEGWGLAFDRETKTLAMSDGTSKIRVLDPTTFKPKRSFDVFWLDANGKKQKLVNLNELEFIGGELWANVFQTNLIVRVDPKSGGVLQTIDCSSIVPESLRESWDYVLNGIAFDGAKNRLFLTGKCWPTLFEFLAIPDGLTTKTV